MTNNPTKYKQILAYGFGGVAFTKCDRWTEVIYAPPSQGAEGQ